MRIVSIPKLMNDKPALRLVEFYEKLGWDQKAFVDNSKVVMTEEDWNVLVSKEIEYANKMEPGSGLQIGLMWMNQGPSGGGNIPGKVKLLPGWLS